MPNISVKGEPCHHKQGCQDMATLYTNQISLAFTSCQQFISAHTFKSSSYTFCFRVRTRVHHFELHLTTIYCQISDGLNLIWQDNTIH